MTPEKCESELDDISARTPVVRFLLEALAKAGCPVKREFFEVQHCSQAVMGGFRPDQGVVLCHNNLMSRTDMENMLAHELVHAYDHCRCAGRARREREPRSTDRGGPSLDPPRETRNAAPRRASLTPLRSRLRLPPPVALPPPQEQGHRLVGREAARVQRGSRE